MKTYLYETRYGNYKVWLDKKVYANDRVALLLMDNDGEQVACATVNLDDELSKQLGDREVFIKTWAENEDMLAFLVKNQIVFDTGREVPTGYVTARICKLLV